MGEFIKITFNISLFDEKISISLSISSKLLYLINFTDLNQ